MKPKKSLYIAVVLFRTPIEGTSMLDSAALMAIDTSARKVISLTRNPSEEVMFFRTGNYISVYRVPAQADLRNYKMHRIGDDTYAETSPIVFTRYFNGKAWEEEWFDDKLKKQIGPAPQPEPQTSVLE